MIGFPVFHEIRGFRTEEGPDFQIGFALIGFEGCGFAGDGQWGGAERAEGEPCGVVKVRAQGSVRAPGRQL